MSELLKTDGIVLRKIDYGDTSRIIDFFTEEFGKVTAILKGAKSPKSRSAYLVDIFNHVHIVLYKKETREVQLLKEVDLMRHFGAITDNLERMKYAMAITELLLNLTVENEPHEKLFKGTLRAFELINSGADPAFYFAKYIVFFAKEIGYEFPVSECSYCGTRLPPNQPAAFNFETGMICAECRKERLIHIEFSKELFNLLVCLTTKKNNISYDRKNVERIIKLMEKFLRYNISEFKGLKSLELH